MENTYVFRILKGKKKRKKNKIFILVQKNVDKLNNIKCTYIKKKINRFKGN